MNIASRSRLRLLTVTVLTLIFLVLLAGNSVPAQTPEPQKPTSEVDQLKQRLQQLEQVVSDLKGQINAIRENFLDGFKADDFRIQFSFKYNFSKTFAF